MKIKLISLLSVIALCISVQAKAWDCPAGQGYILATNSCTPLNTTNNTLGQGQSQDQGQGQGQSQNLSHSGNSTVNDTLSNVVTSSNTNTNTAQGGNANASASNQGNNQSVNVNQASQPRQAPALFAGSLIVPQCGTGAGAGASGPGYGAFANVIWTPHDCKLLRVAGALQALGMYSSACEIVIHTDAFLGTYHRYSIPMPICVDVVPQVVIEAPKPPIEPVVVNVTYPPPVITPVVPIVVPLVKKPYHKPIKHVKKACQPVICPVPK